MLFQRSIMIPHYVCVILLFIVDVLLGATRSILIAVGLTTIIGVIIGLIGLHIYLLTQFL